MNTVWSRKQGMGENLMPETEKKVSELKNTEPVVLAENILPQLSVWLLMKKESMKHGAVYNRF